MCTRVYMFHHQIFDKLKRGAMNEQTVENPGNIRSNNEVTYLLNYPPITFTETLKPQLVVSIEFTRVQNACLIQNVPKVFG